MFVWTIFKCLRLEAMVSVGTSLIFSPWQISYAWVWWFKLLKYSWIRLEKISYLCIITSWICCCQVNQRWKCLDWWPQEVLHAKSPFWCEDVFRVCSSSQKIIIIIRIVRYGFMRIDENAVVATWNLFGCNLFNTQVHPSYLGCRALDASENSFLDPGKPDRHPWWVWPIWDCFPLRILDSHQMAL